ncbi:MAG: restriction endonuclease subunit S [Bacteroidaceae bacterium]|nr:restriction endonuclease subunit S [Bacteroidaceae bacterium]
MDTKKLRQKILDLAIHGKLVPQDPNDEPASVLLERIRAEKERLIKEGKIKRGKKSASDTPHYENEAPFEVPKSWEWTTIGEIASSILYGVSESAKEIGQYKLLRITDIQNNKVNWETVPFTDYDKNKAPAYLLTDGDILFARTGATVGKSYLVEGLKDPAIYASYLIRVQTSSVILPAYIKFFFESGFYWEQISLNSVGIGQPNVNGTTLAALTIPIPTYREQLRIVEEAKKWLMVIDGLDVEIEDLQTSIAQAKSKILDLAIHGKLVSQDPNDEPAIELLKRINPKFTPCDNAHYENVPFEIPKSWRWTCMAEVNEYNSASVDPSKSPNNDFELYSVPAYETGMPEFVKGKDISSSKKSVSKNDVLLCKINPHLNRAWIVSHYKENMPCLASSEWIIFRNSSIIPQYLSFCFTSKYFKELMLSNVSGVGGSLMRAQPAIVNKYLFPLPPINEQCRIVAAIQEYYEILDNMSANL